MHLLLGGIAYELANKKLDELRKEFKTWQELALSADFKA
ncbi:hypothetical protein pah_c221o051 [Parachlamydia acanthamoebae str. Hall's coccus]|nr:hypothetical protein pah_c221o051 [Parachlamydia acanthamoebae str. Hall's coccus]